MYPTKILVVDDAPLMCNHMRTLLKELGYGHVAVATNSTGAMEKFKGNRFNLVFLDIELKELNKETNGLDLLKHFKGMSPKVKIVMVSGFSTPDNVKAALNGGADGFIVKPYHIKKLIDVMEKCNFPVTKTAF